MALAALLPDDAGRRLAAVSIAIDDNDFGARFGESQRSLSISGLVGVDADGKVVSEGDAARQTRQIFENMRLVLEAAGAGFATC